MRASDTVQAFPLFVLAVVFVVAGRPKLREHRDRHRDAQHPDLSAADPQRGAVAARADLRRGGARQRRHEPLDRLPPRAAERDDAGIRAGAHHASATRSSSPPASRSSAPACSRRLRSGGHDQRGGKDGIIIGQWWTSVFPGHRDVADGLRLRGRRRGRAERRAEDVNDRLLRGPRPEGRPTGGVDTVDTRRQRRLASPSAAGEVVGLVGESGSGKSTARSRCSGSPATAARSPAAASSSRVSSCSGCPRRRWRTIRGDQIGLVTQNPRGALNPVMRVGEQIAAIYRAHRKVGEGRGPRRARSSCFASSASTTRSAACARSRTSSRAAWPSASLIAMALACTPELLIADEPTSGLDVTVQAQVLDDLRPAAARRRLEPAAGHAGPRRSSPTTATACT